MSKIFLLSSFIRDIFGYFAVSLNVKYIYIYIYFISMWHKLYQIFHPDTHASRPIACWFMARSILWTINGAYQWYMLHLSDNWNLPAVHPMPVPTHKYKQQKTRIVVSDPMIIQIMSWCKFSFRFSGHYTHFGASKKNQNLCHIIHILHQWNRHILIK